MSKLALGAVLSAACLLASPLATAKSARHAAKAGLQEQVEAEVERSLPKGLQVGTIWIPGSLHRHVNKRSVVALKWRSTPKEGRAVVQVLVHNGKDKVKKGWARVELVRLDTVVVAAVELVAGSTIVAGQLRAEERPRSDGNEISLQPEYLLGSRVVSTVTAGDALLTRDVTMPIPIERGAAVRVEVRRGGVVVGSTGVLETKTLVGAPTRVRVAGRLMSGRLIESDLVELGE